MSLQGQTFLLEKSEMRTNQDFYLTRVTLLAVYSINKDKWIGLCLEKTGQKHDSF